MKTRNPYLVACCMAKFNNDLPDNTRALWDRVNTGNKLGDFEFLRMDATNFSTAKGRNTLTAFARETDAGTMLMIDADMNAGEAQLERILSRPERAVGGIYPKKQLSLSQEWVFNPVKGAAPNADGLLRVRDIGAGFFKVGLELCDQMAEEYPEARYLSEDPNMRGMEIYDLWAEGVVTHDWNYDGKPWPRYLTEDFYFCHRLSQMGVPVYADTLCQCGHFGMVDYLAVMHMIQDLTTVPDPNKQGLRSILPPIVR